MDFYLEKIFFLFFLNYFYGEIYSFSLPYGIDAGDTIFYRNLESEIKFDFKYYLGSDYFSSISIKNDGYLQVSPEYELPGHSPGIPIYCDNINPNIGSIYYRIINDLDTTIKIDQMIINNFKKNYSSIFNLVATWDKVVREDIEDTSINNTFQVVFSSNGQYSTIFYNYINLKWEITDNNFNRAGINFVTFNNNLTEFKVADKINIEFLSLFSNMNEPGTFLLGMDSNDVYVPVNTDYYLYDYSNDITNDYDNNGTNDYSNDVTNDYDNNDTNDYSNNDINDYNNNGSNDYSNGDINDYKDDEPKESPITNIQITTPNASLTQISSITSNKIRKKRFPSRRSL